MKLNVEFLGVARRLTQTKQTQVEVGDHDTYRDVLRLLAMQFPSLLGPVIVPQTYDLVPSYMLNLDGRRAITDLDAYPQDGESLIFMFVEAGG